MIPVRLLIIDDNPGDRTLYKRYLDRESVYAYEYIESTTGNEGILAFDEKVPDCVLLDYFLGDMEGTDVLVAVGDAVRKVPVIMLTGQSDPTVADKVTKLGVYNYLSKSDVTPGGLQKAIEGALRAFGKVA